MCCTSCASGPTRIAPPRPRLSRRSRGRATSPSSRGGDAQLSCHTVDVGGDVRGSPRCGANLRRPESHLHFYADDPDRFDRSIFNSALTGYSEGGVGPAAGSEVGYYHTGPPEDPLLTPRPWL